MAQRERLPLAAEDDLLVGDESRQAHRVHPNALDVDAAGSGSFLFVRGGRRSLVAGPDGVRVTTTGVPWLATAGAGDVLAGLIGSLLAAGLTPYDATSVGSWLHGAAATLASHGGPISAGDVARALPETVRQVLATGMEESGE